MDAWLASEQITGIARFDRHGPWAVVRTDANPNVYLGRNLLTAANVLPKTHTQQLRVVGKHLLVSEGHGRSFPEGLRIEERPMFDFEYTEEEIAELIRKIASKLELSEAESYFEEAIFRGMKDGILLHPQRWHHVKRRIVEARQLSGTPAA